MAHRDGFDRIPTRAYYGGPSVAEATLAHLTIQTRVSHDTLSRRALVIPRSALFRGPAGDWQLFAVRDGKARLVHVQVGLMNDDQAEIRAGLADNEPVIVAPETSLTDGTRVTKVRP